MKPTSDPNLPGVGQERLFSPEDYEFHPPVYVRQRRTMSERLQAFEAALIEQAPNMSPERRKKAVDNCRKFLDTWIRPAAK